MTEREWSLFLEIHSGLEREGPGGRASTERAFAALNRGRELSSLIDIGCGPGAGTLQLAELTEAGITAVDLHQPYLDRLRAEADRRGFGDRILTLKADMGALSLPPETFDAIWSEGAIYTIGFERGVRQWRSLLVPGGRIAVSDLCWLEDNRPAELEEYWKKGYPGIGDRERRFAELNAAGYRLLDSFALPPSDWLDEYYAPLERRLDLLEERYTADGEALGVIAAEREEIEFYRRFSDYYGYIFFIAELPAR